MSFNIAHRHSGDHQIGGMHWLPGMCCGLSRKRYAQPVIVFASVAAPTSDGAGLGHGGGDCGVVLWCRRFCKNSGLLGFARVAGHLSATGFERGSGSAPDARGKVRLPALPSPNHRSIRGLERNLNDLGDFLGEIIGGAQVFSQEAHLTLNIAIDDGLSGVIGDVNFQSQRGRS